MKISALIKKACYWVGGIMVGIAVLLAISTMLFVGKAEKATGTIVDLDENYGPDTVTYIPIIEYENAQGELLTYDSAMAVNEGKYMIGQEIHLLYVEKSDGEHKVKIDEFGALWTGSLILGIGGILIAIIGLVFGYTHWAQERMKKYLRAKGTKIEAPITEIKYEVLRGKNQAAGVSLSMYVIYVQWKLDNGQEVTFKTHGLRRDPREFGKDAGSQVTVYFDPQNPKKHFIDIDFIPLKFQY